MSESEKKTPSNEEKKVSTQKRMECTTWSSTWLC